MVGHGFEFDDVAAALDTDVGDELFESVVHVASDDWSPIFWAPDDVEGAAIDNVVV